jgi:hypothetical protein
VAVKTSGLALVLDNSKRIKKWVKTEPAHDGIAILCGGGPSLADTLREIREIKGKVFALNGAASYLDKNGIAPDFQVIMDAKPETASLVGPAKRHLFASQVDPECFNRVPTATLWHATYGNLKVDEQPGFPKHDDDYCLIGAAVSAGNTALVLLYALGYRTIHVFGMDSSRRWADAGHAYRQAMNDGEPCTVVEYGGKEYICSVPMAMQAKHFVSRAAQLRDAGVSIHVHGSGLLPDMANSPELDEVAKYEQMWGVAEYRTFSPGEHSVDKFLGIVKPDGLVIDFGCGTGRAALRMRRAGLPVILVDFAGNCRDQEAITLPFVKWDLNIPLGIASQYGYCTDVMEHIPTKDVASVINNIMASAPETYFQISTVPDSFGSVIGQPLHLTVRPHGWWREMFVSHGYSIEWEEHGAIFSSFLVKREKSA